MNRPASPKRPALRPTPLVLALALAISTSTGLAQTPSGSASLGTPVAFSIAAKPLGQALGDWAVQSRIQLIVQPALVAGKVAPAVSGSLAPRQALDRLLSGSGLAAEAQGNAVVVTSSPLATASEAVLPLVTATARTGSDATAPRETGYRAETSVSAGLGERPVLDTPYSVSTVTAEVMADQQARSLIDIVKNDPSVTLDFPTFDDTVSIRGFGVDMAHRDGFSMSRQVRTPLQNKASVEFLRGLSGFRYGFNSPGGVVSYTVKRPTDEPLTSVTVGADSEGSVGAHIDASRRFGQNKEFGLRLNAYGEDFQSFMNNVEGRRALFSLFADWRLTPDLTLEFDYEDFRDKRNPNDLTLASFGSVSAARAILPLLTPEMSNAQPWLVEDRRQKIYSVRANYRFNPNWKGSLSWMKTDADVPYAGPIVSNLQADGTYTLGTYYSGKGKRDNQGLIATLDGSFFVAGLKSDLVLGLTTDERYLDGSDSYFLPDLGVANLFRSEVIANALPAPGSPGAGSFAVKSIRRSAIVNNTLHLDAQWQLLTGLAFNSLKGSDPRTGVVSYDESAISPTLGLVHKLSSTTSLYASYATGLEEGGSAPSTAGNFSGSPLSPLKSKQVEVGIKHEFGQGALATLAVFRLDKGLEYVNDANLFVQDGRQVHDGVEATFAGQLGRDLRLIAGLTLLDATIKEAAVNVGKQPAGVPKSRASLYADWRWPAVDRNFWLTGGVQLSSRKFVDAANELAVSGYAVYEIGTRYRHAAGSSIVTYRAAVENLFDKRHFSSVGAYEGIYFGAPRTFKLSATVDF